MDNNEKYTEYFWERQLREEDRKLHACMHAMPSVIDLPSEDDILTRHIFSAKDYSFLDALNMEELFSEINFESLSMGNSEVVGNSEWHKVYSDIDRLMRSWAMYYVELSEDFDILRILCFYGNLLGMTVKLMNYTKDGQNGLLRALAKRLVSKLNKILILIEEGNFDLKIVKSHKLGLFRVRSLVMNLLFAIKRKHMK